MTRLITVAIHTYDRALALKALLEHEGIPVVFSNVNIEEPQISSGVRVRIAESDLPLALRIIENKEVFASSDSEHQVDDHCILVPVDFSLYSIEAVKAAAALASKHKASMRLLNSFLDPYVAGNMQLGDSMNFEMADSEARRRLEEKASKEMDDFADSIRGMMKHGDIDVVKFSTKVAEGVPEDVIMEHAKVNPPLLTVMGTRGADRKERELIGSVTAEVLDQSGFSVLTVPETVKGDFVKNMKKILFFANLNQTDILAMDTFRRIFPESKIEVNIVALPQRRNLFIEKNFSKRVKNLVTYFMANYINCSFEAIGCENPGKLKENLSILPKDFDMVVIPNRRKVALSRLLNPSLAHSMVFNADIPMLAIPV